MSTPYYAPYPSSPTESTYSTGESSTSSPTVSQYRYSPGRQIPSPSTPVAPSGTCSSDDQSSQNGDYTVTHDRRGRVTSSSSISKLDISHPYARLYAKKEEGKRRKIWNHALEKALFSPYELSTLGAPHRRTIYMASLEAHVDRLHAQLLSLGFWPVAFEELEPFRGLNSKTAKSMVAGLQYDASQAKLKLLELERANEGLVRSMCSSDVTRNGDASVGSNFDYAS